MTTVVPPAFRRALAALAVALPVAAGADAVAVRHWEGLTHGFVALSALDGTRLADGDLVQRVKPTKGGQRVSVRLLLRFKDGSLHEESTVYVQQRTFRFVSDHLVQKGPSFKTQLDATIASDGRVTVRATDENGKAETFRERLQLPGDVANGLVMPLLKNLSPNAPKTTVSYVAITPKPRIVHLEMAPSGEDPFSTGATERKATRWVIKVTVPGVEGAVASVLGKVPPDSHVWILGGEAPAFVKAEMPLSTDGPVQRIEMLVPTWPRSERAGRR